MRCCPILPPKGNRAIKGRVRRHNKPERCALNHEMRRARDGARAQRHKRGTHRVVPGGAFRGRELLCQQIVESRVLRVHFCPPHRLRDYRKHIRRAMGLAHRSNPPTRCVTFADELEARSP